MENLFLFDSQLKKHKEPFGAVVCGEQLKLSAYALRSEVFSVTLVVYSEYEGTTEYHPLEWTTHSKAYDVYSIVLPAPEKAGIYWYCFRLTTTSGNELFFGKNGVKGDINSILSFQLTVSDGAYTTPTWFSEGVTYHAFVDRFNRAKTSPKLFEDPYFRVHTDTSETPVFRPNEHGVIENRDIYGGNLEGIIEKLPYLSELGVKTIYLSPIFEAWSNHKYNTADYKKVDSHFGDEKALSKLCKEAGKQGIRIILDGVFSHTGSDSLYFNREGRYGDNVGAWRDFNSPFRSWFDINEHGKYSSWWGIDTLPQVNELNNEYQNFIIKDEDSVIAHWMRAGVSGWRLDVADELPDEFIGALKTRAVQEKSDALVIGEVWEDASTKKAYGVNKTYFTEGVLDGVMNYPLKNAILDFLCERIPAEHMKYALMQIIENYPKISQRCLMNIIGTHDTVRAINELSVGSCGNESKEYRANRMLSDDELIIGKRRLHQAAVLQYMFPGSPCIYYGDEIGMQGFEDPFNRRYFTWDNMDTELLDFYRELGKIKNENACMKAGEFSVPYAKADVFVASRGDVIAFINRGEKVKYFSIPDGFKCVLNYGNNTLKNSKLKLNGCSCCALSR